MIFGTILDAWKNLIDACDRGFSLTPFISFGRYRAYQEERTSVSRWVSMHVDERQVVSGMDRCHDCVPSHDVVRILWMHDKTGFLEETTHRRIRIGTCKLSSHPFYHSQLCLKKPTKRKDLSSSMFSCNKAKPIRETIPTSLKKKKQEGRIPTPSTFRFRNRVSIEKMHRVRYRISFWFRSGSGIGIRS